MLPSFFAPFIDLPIWCECYAILPNERLGDRPRSRQIIPLHFVHRRGLSALTKKRTRRGTAFINEMYHSQAAALREKVSLPREIADVASAALPPRDRPERSQSGSEMKFYPPRGFRSLSPRTWRHRTLSCAYVGASRIAVRADCAPV